MLKDKYVFLAWGFNCPFRIMPDRAGRQLTETFLLIGLKVISVVLPGSGLWRQWVCRSAEAAPSRSPQCPVSETLPLVVWQIVCT